MAKIREISSHAADGPAGHPIGDGAPECFYTLQHERALLLPPFPKMVDAEQCRPLGYVRRTDYHAIHHLKDLIHESRRCRQGADPIAGQAVDQASLAEKHAQGREIPRH